MQAIRQGTSLLASGDEGICGVELANAMMLATWTDDWVDMPVDEERFYEELQKRVANSELKEGVGKVMDVDGTF